MADASKVARLVLPDSKALSLFEHDPSVNIIDKQQELPGYELYLVEQWAASREYLTSLITTFTGLTYHKVKVHVLEIPTEEKEWSERLRTYVENISKPPARRKETPYGTLMVTNLSSFASTLTILNIPGGDYDNYRDIFVVNENLKRMGCYGRAGLSLSEPSAAVTTKFRQLYHTSDIVPINEAAVELVRFCQVALVLFAQLAREYTDGLLCDITIEAVKSWWTQIGLDHFNAEPSDGVLGPTTVAALLGLAQGARIRLQSLNAPIGKDVFDLRSSKRAIEAFQKWYKLDRTRRLDPKTLERLHNLTAKSVTGKEWMVPRAVKSTIPQLGKGGEMVMGMVSNKERAGISDVETLDMNTFASVASGNSAKWLWQGKRRKPVAEGSTSRFSSDEEPSADETPLKTQRKRDVVLDKVPAISYFREGLYSSDIGSQVSLDQVDREQPMHKHVFKSVTGRMNDARSGLGRIRDAVSIPGLRGHASKLSRDIYGSVHDPFTRISAGEERLVGEGPHEPTNRKIPAIRTGTDPSAVSAEVEQSPASLKSHQSHAWNLTRYSTQDNARTSNDLDREDKAMTSGQQTPSVASQHNVDPALLNTKEMLIRSTSYNDNQQTIDGTRSVPRRALSFEDISNALGPSGYPQKNGQTSDINYEYANDEYLIELAISMRKQLVDLESNKLAKAKHAIYELRDSDKHVAEDLETIHKKYMFLLSEHAKQQQEAADTVTTARATIGDTLLRVEGIMSKLEYELSMLASKIEDVEDGVTDFEDQVVNLEMRAQALGSEEEKPVASRSWQILSTFLGLT